MAVNKGPSTKLRASVEVAAFIGKNIVGSEVQTVQNVSIIESTVCSAKQAQGCTLYNVH